MAWFEGPSVNGRELGINELSLIKDRLTLLEAKDRPIFIHIAGASGAGKTTCSKLLSALVEGCQTFEMDRYLKGKAYVDNLESTSNPSQSFYGWDDIRVFDLSSIQNDLHKMREGKQVTVPIFNRQKGEREGAEMLPISKFVLVEGIHALDRNLSREADIKILVIAPFHDRLMRRMVRNYLGYGLRPVSQILSNYIQRVEPSYQLHHQEYFSVAQYSVDNPGNPITEFTQFLNLRENSDIVYSSPSETYTLSPLAGFGMIREGEQFIVSKFSGQWQLRYTVGGVNFINADINEETIVTLQRHYSFMKV